MLGFVLRLKKLGWKWWTLITIVTLLLIVFVFAPAYVYLSRHRNPPNYSDIQSKGEMSFRVSYDNGNGVVDQSQRTLLVTQTNILKDSKMCYEIATIYSPYPKRKVNAPVVGSTNITLAKDEMWRSRQDFRMIYEEVMQTHLPIVNTAVVKISYSEYQNYPGWPYHLNDSWTYQETFNPDVPFQSSWVDQFRAVVVADDAVVEVGGIEYQCFKVVHTLIETGDSNTSGGGVGASVTEYWCKDVKLFAPIKFEDYISYRGIETQVISNSTLPASPSWLNSPS